VNGVDRGPQCPHRAERPVRRIQTLPSERSIEPGDIFEGKRGTTTSGNDSERGTAASGKWRQAGNDGKQQSLAEAVWKCRVEETGEISYQ
jgi:hypothetical protein